MTTASTTLVKQALLAVSLLAATRASEANSDAVSQALVWLPIKDLETFDAFLRNLEDALDRPMLVAQARMRPLKDPMKMNGCALVLVDGPAVGPEMSDICVWTTAALGEYGAARVHEIG